MVGPIQWAEAGVAPFREEQRKFEDEPEYELVHDLFESAEKELWTAQPWLFGFGLDIFFGEAEREWAAENELVLVGLQGFRNVAVAFRTDKSFYDAIIGDVEA
jgi:hypothetical protein